MTDRDHSNTESAQEPLSADEGAAALEAILDPPKEPVKKQVQQKEEAEGDEPEVESDGEESEDAQASADDEAEIDDQADDDDDEAEDDESEASGELSDDVEVDLGDGKATTLATLKEAYAQGEKRIEDFRANHNRRMSELKQREDTYVAQEKRVLEHAQRLKSERELLMQAAQQLLPSEPEMPQDDDPFEWSEYQRRKAIHERQVQALNQMAQQSQQSIQEAQNKERINNQKKAQQEWLKLLEKRPELKDRNNLERVNREVTSLLGDAYGFTPQELGQFVDHRFRQAMLDLADFHKGKKAAPSAKAKVNAAPKMLKSGKQVSKKEKSSRGRQARREALRRNPSDLKTQIDALMDFEL